MNKFLYNFIFSLSSAYYILAVRAILFLKNVKLIVALGSLASVIYSAWNIFLALSFLSLKSQLSVISWKAIHDHLIWSPPYAQALLHCAVLFYK